MKYSKLFISVFFPLTFGLTVSAIADPLQLDIDPSGKLRGASGVSVDGNLYDVEFTDSRTCSELYDGCDSISDFTFQTHTAAINASMALLDAVLLDGADGSFDSDPEKTQGCALVSFCDIYTPYDIFPIDTFLFARVAIARNWSESGPDMTGFGLWLNNGGFNDDSFSDRTWALWSPSQVTAVPEPATMFLLGTGLVGVAGLARRRKKNQA